MSWLWLGRWLLPERPPAVDEGAGDAVPRALAEAEEARRNFERVARRARAVGIDVDLARSWGPHADRPRCP